MKNIAGQIRTLINSTATDLLLMKAEEVGLKKTPEDWSKKEILGHLIDSAANNHQRFVRACYNAASDFPPYSQNDWVCIQQYNDLDWETLVTFWSVYNRHLAHLIECIPQEALSSPCNIGKAEPVTLEFLIKDYLRHLQHHLNDLLA
jgi:hypothetical protein